MLTFAWNEMKKNCFLLWRILKKYFLNKEKDSVPPEELFFQEEKERCTLVVQPIKTNKKLQAIFSVSRVT